MVECHQHFVPPVTRIVQLQFKVLVNNPKELVWDNEALAEFKKAKEAPANSKI